MDNFIASLNKTVFDSLLTEFFREIALLSPAQELELTGLLLNTDDDTVEIEADVFEDTLQ